MIAHPSSPIILEQWANAALATVGATPLTNRPHGMASHPLNNGSRMWLACWLLRFEVPGEPSYPEIRDAMGYRAHASVWRIIDSSCGPRGMLLERRPALDRLAVRFWSIARGEPIGGLTDEQVTAAFRAVFGDSE